MDKKPKVLFTIRRYHDRDEYFHLEMQIWKDETGMETGEYRQSTYDPQFSLTWQSDESKDRNLTSESEWEKRTRKDWYAFYPTLDHVQKFVESARWAASFVEKMQVQDESWNYKYQHRLGDVTPEGALSYLMDIHATYVVYDGRIDRWVTVDEIAPADWKVYRDGYFTNVLAPDEKTARKELLKKIMARVDERPYLNDKLNAWIDNGCPVELLDWQREGPKTASPEQIINWES